MGLALWVIELLLGHTVIAQSHSYCLVTQLLLSHTDLA